jgi:hypothetical protein
MQSYVSNGEKSTKPPTPISTSQYSRCRATQLQTQDRWVSYTQVTLKNKEKEKEAEKTGPTSSCSLRRCSPEVAAIVLV